MGWRKDRRDAREIGSFLLFDRDCGVCGTSGEVEGLTPEDPKEDCPHCSGTGMVLTELGENVVNFLDRLGWRIGRLDQIQSMLRVLTMEIDEMKEELRNRKQ